MPYRNCFLLRIAYGEAQNLYNKITQSDQANLWRMVKAYDDWERLVVAVLRREQFRQLCRLDSLSSASSSDLSSSLGLSSSFSNLPFDAYEHGLPKYARPPPFQDLARIEIDLENDKPEFVLFEGSPSFGIQELLMAPAYILGDNIEAFNRTYAFSLKDGKANLVVKRLRTEGFSRTKFNRIINYFIKEEHENIFKMRGYYFSKEVRLAIYDYYPEGSVCAMLHGKRWENRVALDWETRLKVALGVAKGLAHLHLHKIVHGNIKASNIFLNSQGYGCLADVNLENISISAYHPPFAQIEDAVYIYRETDVYSLGVLLLELLSGRSPLHAFGVRNRKKYVDWARYNARDEWTALVYDMELLKNPVMKQEMREVLAIALSCVEKEPKDRPEMKHVVEKIEFIFQGSYVYEF